jgi:hypothetical protein
MAQFFCDAVIVLPPVSSVAIDIEVIFPFPGLQVSH